MSELSFYLNGEQISIPQSELDPSLTLNEYIRRQTRFKGTKLSCGEGGCGACAVDVAKVNPNTKQVEHFSVNSCLRPLASVGGSSITTTDGLGNSSSGFHPIHEKIAGFNGSQCGFCTPGMVMTLYSTLQENPKRTMQDIEKQFDGNICRCTGYRPILDACKSFACDSDIEDLVCKQQKCGGFDSNLSPSFPESLLTPEISELRASKSGIEWLRPTNLEEVFLILGQHEQKNVRFVVANTSVGIYKKQTEKVFVDLQYIPELLQITNSDDGITFGASVTLTHLSNTLERVFNELNNEKVRSFPALVSHIYRIANVHVRNAGSIAGNLSITKTFGFLSDLATILIGARASVTLVSKAGLRTISLEEFLSTPTYEAGEFIHSIKVPFSSANDHFRSYKTAVRPNNAHAFVNSAFNVSLDENGVVQSALLAFGGILKYDQAGSHPVRANKTEEVLVGKKLSNELLQSALTSLKEEIVPEGTKKKFRSNLVTGFFYKFFLDILNNFDSSVPEVLRSGIVDEKQRPVSKGNQKFQEDNQNVPVSQPVNHISAKLQAAGEAVYTDDIRPQCGTVYAALVTSKISLAKIKNIDASDALKSTGVVGFITAKDVKGKNSCSVFGENQQVFAESDVKFYGQPIGVILADTDKHAVSAAKLVKIEYDTEGKSPVLTIEQSLEAKGEYATEAVAAFKNGDVSAALESATHKLSGKITMGSQKHFYMEPHNAYAIPDEDGGITVHCPNQWPDALQSQVAGALAIPSNKVRISHRRGGGGFGGKITHSVQIACIAAVSSQASRRPVRLVLDRNADMEFSGGRDEVLANYDVGFDDNGKISAVKFEGFLNGGYLVDLSGFSINAVATSLNQAYSLPHNDISVKVVLSNLCNRTVARGPGEIEGSYAMETIIEHIAHTLNLSPEDVRERNFFNVEYDDQSQILPNGKPLTHYTIPQLWKEVKEKSNFEVRRKAVEEFNQANRWKKRGISITPVRYEVHIWNKSALINIYGDGSVIVHHTGAEIGQGLNTKVAQAVAYKLGSIVNKPLDISSIRFGEMDSLIVPNGTFTGGSTGSEGTALAALKACDTILKRLLPVLEELKQKRKEENNEAEITWGDLIGAARGKEINLSAQDSFSAEPGEDVTYSNYGVASSEVEIDVLTGESNILQTDLLYDCGKSLNPAIDIGQCEGAFIMGVGHYLREEEIINQTTGELISNGTWEYKPPLAADIPIKFNVELLSNPRFDKGLLSSKSSGEPPLVLSTSVIMAVRNAVKAARKDVGLNDFFPLHVPATPEVIQEATGNDASHLTL